LNLSLYFEELRTAYRAEIDDLQTDSEGKNVLASRLQQKRSQFAALMPMIGFAPEMVAPAFHGGVRIDDPRAITLLSFAEPEDFPAWTEIKDSVSFEPWAEKLVQQVLAEADGERFLLTVVCLEFLHAKDNDRGAVRRATGLADDEEGDAVELDQGLDDDGEQLDGEGERRHGGRDDDEDGADLDEAGADWMSEQGFDRRG
jgi:hypothetical protein